MSSIKKRRLGVQQSDITENLTIFIQIFANFQPDFGNTAVYMQKVNTRLKKQRKAMSAFIFIYQLWIEYMYYFQVSSNKTFPSRFGVYISNGYKHCQQYNFRNMLCYMRSICPGIHDYTNRRATLKSDKRLSLVLEVSQLFWQHLWKTL